MKFSFYKYIILTVITLLFSQSEPSEVEISSISIEGNNRFSAEDVSRHIKLYPGMKISGEDIQEIIKRVWAKNIYRDIQIYIENETPDGHVQLLIKVDEFPVLNRIELLGNSKIKSKKILNELDLINGQVLSDIDISNSMNNIKNYFMFCNSSFIQRSIGYFLDHDFNFFVRIEFLV